MSAAVEHRLRNSRLLQYRVIGLARRVGERSFDVIGLEVGKIAKNFIVRHTVGQHSENVRHSNTKSPDARPAAALVWFQRVMPAECMISATTFCGNPSRMAASISRSVRKERPRALSPPSCAAIS